MAVTPLCAFIWYLSPFVTHRCVAPRRAFFFPLKTLVDSIRLGWVGLDQITEMEAVLLSRNGEAKELKVRFRLSSRQMSMSMSMSTSMSMSMCLRLCLCRCQCRCLCLCQCQCPCLCLCLCTLVLDACRVLFSGGDKGHHGSVLWACSQCPLRGHLVFEVLVPKDLRALVRVFKYHISNPIQSKTSSYRSGRKGHVQG